MLSNISFMSGASEFHANGKLLLTGEYLVLAGARALALPLRFGQDMVAADAPAGLIDWTSSTPAGTWFTAKFETESLRIISTDDLKTADELKKILSSLRHLNPGLFSDAAGHSIIIRSNYPLEWGLGSSSSLCHLVASWAGVDAFDLHSLISTGSGYDVACAGRQDLLYYQLKDRKPLITPAIAGRALREHSYFAWLGNKQDTGPEIEAFRTNRDYSEKDIDEVSEISLLICGAKSYDELFRLTEEHESVLSTILKREPIARRFPGFPGTAKSLGAWGGDFAMFVSGQEPAEVIRILHTMGFQKVFTYNDIKAAT
jgi:hypothetical protein